MNIMPYIKKAYRFFWSFWKHPKENTYKIIAIILAMRYIYYKMDIEEKIK